MKMFFCTDSSSSNSWIFFWMDNPSHLNGIERMANSKQKTFSRSNSYPLVYIFMWGLQLRIWLFIQEWTTWLSQHDVTGQHNWWVKFLAGQVTILAGHCLLTSRYFEPCSRLKPKILREMMVKHCLIIVYYLW